MSSGSSRRDFIKAGLLGAGSASMGLLSLAGCSAGRPASLPEMMGPLGVVPDETTGLPLLRLPEGFRYKTLSWAGSRLHDGYEVPTLADGMGVVRTDGALITLIRNHELAGSSGPIGDPATAYDVTGGGTTTLVFDADKEELTDSWVSLGGTLYNCAGGVTPWGSWLSCEEAPISPALFNLPTPSRQRYWGVENARQEHGFVFEVPARGIARPEPIREMGQFYHEAVAFDPASGIAYMTEDNEPEAGFYRFIPVEEGNLHAGGRLQMMRVPGRRELRNGLRIGEYFPVEWVDIEHPDRGFERGGRLGNGIVRQGRAAGGSAFISLEGCTFDAGRIYFTSKTGGEARAGYIFEYEPAAECLRLIYESSGHGIFSGPDNIVVSPRGSLVICEDRVTDFKVAQSIAGLTTAGEFFRFCQINPGIEGIYGGFDLADTARQSEWAGATFSGDGRWLFVNIYAPGVTVAITGPWQSGLI